VTFYTKAYHWSITGCSKMMFLSFGNNRGNKKTLRRSKNVIGEN